MTEEPATCWRRGDRWPSAWKAQPVFSLPDGSRADFVEITNGPWLVQHLGYPTGQMIPLPDRYGQTTTGLWILWEEKTRDNVGNALRQLTHGLRELTKLGRSVDILGVSLERFDGKEPWKCRNDGLLIRRGQVDNAPYMISSRKVMVEQRRR